VFNDLAVAARQLLDQGRARRVAVIDLDVHHGDGTAAIFADDPTVWTLSVHGERIYPAVKPSSDLDVALPAGIGDETYLAALQPALARTFDQFCPDFVLYQAGADPYEGDQLGQFQLSSMGLARRDRLVFDYCSRSGVPVAVTMGGGYARNIDEIVDIHSNTIRLTRLLLPSLR